MKIFEILLFFMIVTFVHSNAKLSTKKNSDNPRNLSLLTDLLAASA